MILNWNPKSTEHNVREVLRTLAEEYPLQESAQNVNLILEKTDEMAALMVSDVPFSTFSLSVTMLSQPFMDFSEAVYNPSVLYVFPAN